MYAGYMSMSGTEIVNTPRLGAYMENTGFGTLTCDGCGPDFYKAVFDDPYNTPEMDDPSGMEGLARGCPWYDQHTPASAEFLGVGGMEVLGFANAVHSRKPVPLIGDGSMIGGLRRSHREVTWKCLLVATTDCGLNYGIAWLSTALRGSVCRSSATCRGDIMCVMACCPKGDPTVSGYGNEQARYIYDCGILEGPTLTKTYKLNGGWAAEVEFTIVAGKPYIYQAAVPLLPPKGVPVGMDARQAPPQVMSLAAGSQIVSNFKPCDGKSCAPPRDTWQASNCNALPNCKEPSLPPMATVPVDPCWSNKPYNAYRQLIQVAPHGVPVWFESVPVVNVYTGNKDLRRMTIRFHVNPTGAICNAIDEPWYDSCNACAEINVDCLPKNAKLTIDGRVQRAKLDFPGVSVEPHLMGRCGNQFTWPVNECSSGYCIEVFSDANYTAPDMTVSVEMYPREETS